MAARDRLPPWHERHRLPNGREVLIRPIRPEDAEPLRAGFGLLEPEAARAPLSGNRELSTNDADRLSRPNPRTEFTLVATDLDAPGEAVVAAIAYIHTDAAAHEGDFTLLVSRFVAGMGMRRYLLTRVAKWARSRGLGVLRGELPQDADVLALAGTLGFRTVEGANDPSMARVALELPRR
ncbi:N-acetyltransferase [Lysobacter sp. TY2-98]|uniref:GNAT family N-acetyltransferase n=1 Tax=Lysobacter sp. TY2-98 TaxID=2290922 RepID=UPI000E1FFA8C|nr:N-acetyltransferase [Lysobacter sp. TY2-98]AXK72359.1 N-acetyltransferase [Lysobacter sp. TY2-98]